MADAYKGDLLSLPYRDRQLVAVMPKQVGESTIERVEIRLSDYFLKLLSIQ